METIKKLILIFTLFIFGISQSDAQTKLKPTVEIHGLIQYNFEFHKIGNSTYAGNEFRKMVITAKGNIYKNIAYVAQLDFAEGTVGVRDVYLKFGKLPFIGGHLLVGSSIEPTGLDQFTGSKFKTFAERSLMASTQGFRWNSGFFYNNYSLLNNNMGLQLAYTFNGDKDHCFTNNSIDKEGNFMARITGTILNNKEKYQIVHLGVRYENRKRGDNKYVQGFKPEVHMGDKFIFAVPNIDQQNDYGFEIAANYGPLSIQGEYEISTFKHGEKDNSISGYYGYISFFPTEEHRPYKNTTFGMVIPKKNFCVKDGGWGAIELAIRYSAMDYNNAGSLPKYQGNPIGGETISNLTLGLNWYLNSHTRITYNYILGDMQLEDNFTANLIKFQVKF